MHHGSRFSYERKCGSRGRPGRLTLQIVQRTDDMSGFVVLPRRWVVERTLSWLMRSRRLARDYETRPESSETAVLWSMTMLMGRRLARHRSRNVTRQPASA
ncbi:transposase [Streptomyces sp. NBC_00207]|uniref:transposase n=1 Tax=unclassified Streptomyces TaxID=2593676 RepID=UPI00386500B4